MNHDSNRSGTIIKVKGDPKFKFIAAPNPYIEKMDSLINDWEKELKQLTDDATQAGESTVEAALAHFFEEKMQQLREIYKLLSQWMTGDFKIKLPNGNEEAIPMKGRLR